MINLIVGDGGPTWVGNKKRWAPKTHYIVDRETLNRVKDCDSKKEALKWLKNQEEMELIKSYETSRD